MGKRTVFVIMLASLAALLLAMSGCGTKSEPVTEEKGTEHAQEKETEKETQAEVLSVGDTVSVEGGKVTVSKVTVTNDLASPEANALLLTGEPGESSNRSQAPAAGKEFLLITFEYQNTGTSASAGIRPVDLNLVNAKGDVYDLVTTSGFGGLFNAKPIDPGKKASVTAVYEVPAGEKGLTLTYKPFGSEPAQFKIR